VIDDSVSAQLQEAVWLNLVKYLGASKWAKSIETFLEGNQEWLNSSSFPTGRINKSYRKERRSATEDNNGDASPSKLA